MNNYYCLVAGLPDISIDDGKLSYSVADFKESIYPQLSEMQYAECRPAPPERHRWSGGCRLRQLRCCNHFQISLSHVPGSGQKSFRLRL